MNLLNLPKIELHCHLDGSLRVETAIELAKKEGIELDNYDYDKVKELLVIPEECESLDDYLKRFDLPVSILQRPENLERVAFELMEDANKENVKYIEIRFAPLFHLEKGMTQEEVISSVIKGIRKAEELYDIRGNVILSCLRHHSVDSVYEVIEAGKKFIGKGVVAIDLAGCELENFVKPYEEVMKVAREAGFRVTIHAGETGYGKNVRDAIELLGAERIGHGLFIFNDEEAYNLVKNKGVTLEMCPKSNIDTKGVAKYEEHPIYKYHKDDIKVNLSTDNRTVSNITLTEEFENVDKAFNIDFEDYKKIYLDSVDASFCTNELKEQLKLAI
ncbi:adenosine deaminase [Clostridium sp. LIBA-8841]|uniref:adenosine deaminase n=1 Tax=Clostridium sp. LIBA-8841 TaxID=2987530 RepID=UPI002AC53408|nr:adenosine deaminase [Clostridium sp. LIBA-8841]MDZ5254695.1 adenosine deaminase [Clostridium sp. LIBA-8841]